MAFLEADGLAQVHRGFLKAIVARVRSHHLGQRRGDEVELLLRGLFLEVCPQGQADQPDPDDAGTYEEERRLADPEVGRLDEPVKQRTAISPRAGFCGLGALHSRKPTAPSIQVS
jgi:hypothetical protein